MTQAEIFDLLKKHHDEWLTVIEMVRLLGHVGSIAKSLRALRKTNFVNYKVIYGHYGHKTFEYQHKDNE